MTGDAPLDLDVAMHPTNCPSARAAVARFRESPGLPREALDRVRLAVTEASTNCVLPAC
jgi:anti-sigma regulatory factor (Ser/Thr protein kinase)